MLIYSRIRIHGTTVKVEDVEIPVKVDSGADVSIINIEEFKRLKNPPNLIKCKIKYKAYNQTDIKVHGKCLLQIETQNGTYDVLKFVIADYESILSGNHSIRLGLIKKLFSIQGDNAINTKIFDEIGCLKDEIKIHLRSDAVPVIHPPRKVPISLHKKLKDELDRMVRLEVIQPIDEPTEWVSSLVIIEKPDGRIRVCLDPKPLNKAIKRQHYPLPTTEEIFDKMKDAHMFSKLDASSGYWQIKVDEESSKLLCFNTPFGRYKFKRLPFGIHIASEIFQNKIEQILEGLQGTANSQDDIIVWGKNKTEHDKRLQDVMDRIYKSGLRLNKQKCEIGKDDIIFLGHRITKQGVHPDPEKIKAISKLEMPKDVTGVQRILGMIGYVGKFIPDLSEITKPFRQLIENGSEFRITDSHKKALKRIKYILTSNPILKRFDIKKETKLSADASKDGLGAVLLQRRGDTWFPASYASRTLAKNEQNYAQIEKECLATVFACTRFHHYVYGRAFQCETDHKPLETLFKKSISDAPPRIQRMIMTLVKYPDMTLKFVPGKSLKMAGTLSRAPLISQNAPETNELDCQVHLVTSNLPISDQKMVDFRYATNNDLVLNSLKHVILKGWPNYYSQCPQEVREYWQHRDTLNVEDGLIYKGERLVVPRTMRNLIKTKIHEGHLGITKCTIRAKTYFFWPFMMRHVKDVVERYETCQEYRKAQPKQPNMSRDVDIPWHTVGCDIFHHGTSHYVIVTDYFSSYPEVILIN